MNIGKLFFIRKTCWSKIYKFNPRFSKFLKHNIFWFNITMNNIPLNLFLNYMMQKQKCLHELDEYLPDNINIKTLIILSLDITIDIHTKHLGYYTLHPNIFTICPRNSKSPLISTIFLFVEVFYLTTFKILTYNLNCSYNY